MIITRKSITINQIKDVLSLDEEESKRLIQYRIDNNLNRKNLDIEKIYSFMCHFILTHPELSEKNKEKREQLFIENNDTEEKNTLGYNKLVKMLKK